MPDPKLISIIIANNPGRFVSVKYTDKQGGKGIYTMILASYGKLLCNALGYLGSLNDHDLQIIHRDLVARDDFCIQKRPPVYGRKAFTLQMVREVYQDVIANIETAMEYHADGMPRKGNYTDAVCDDNGFPIRGLRTHIEDSTRVYVAGIKAGFHPLKAGDKKEPTNSAPETLIGNLLRKKAGLSKWRHLKGGTIEKLSANGETYQP